MNEQIKDGGPAFPRNYSADGHNGATLRDYFAAKALPIIRSQNVARGDRQFSVTAKDAYAMADAMLLAREQTNGRK